MLNSHTLLGYVCGFHSLHVREAFDKINGMHQLISLWGQFSETVPVSIKLDDDLQSLATGVSKLDGPGADKEAVSQQLATVQQQIEQVRGENEELRTFFQEALQEAERLKHENEELRKLGEDAVLDQQLSKALQETDKLKLAADAYKKELLQQKVGELQAELAQTAKRLKVAEEEKSALQGAKGGRRDSFKRLDKQASHQFPNGLAGENAASSASLQTSSGERKDLLARLQGPQQTRGDLDQLLVAAAKVLQDAETLETQLAEARSRNAQLQGEVEKLNDTVFSKTFRAPSAWAEREVKYKMEKKDWDTQVERLQGIINKLTAENVGYRDNNKTQEFEVRIQELQQMLKQTESSKVTAERALHELQLDMRGQIEKYDQLQEARRHQEVLSEEGVTSMIDGFDRQQIGGVQPRRTQTKGTAKQAPSALVPDATSAEPSALQHIQEASPHTHVQEVVSDFDTHHIGAGQLPSSSAIGIPPAEHQLPEVASVSAQEAAGAFQEQGPARHNDPDQQGGSLTLEAATSPGVQQEGSETEAEHRGAGFPVGPLDEDDSETSSSEDDLLTVKDAVTHIVRSTRHSRANSSEHLDQLDHKEASPSGRSDPQTAADPLAAVRGVTFSDAGHISLSGASSLPPLTTRRAPGSSKDASEMNGGATTERSESSEAWSEERIRQLEEDKAAIERLWGEHAQENDIGVLKFKLAEFESRCEMYEAQVTKMQRSLERGDDEKAKVEEQLAKAMALTAQGDKQGLAALRDRLSMVVTGRASKTSQLEERLKEAEEQLQQSYRERARLEKQRAKLEQELASWSSKLGVNMDLSRAESLEPSEPSSSDKGERKLQHWKSSGSNIAGLNDGDMEVMRLREENEALMDSLVRTKVELAETEGEYLKTKRSLIRANEKLAGLSEKLSHLQML
ncbi:hypothetical protein WJX79_008756 [Trebouxia sp. C0005]